MGIRDVIFNALIGDSQLQALGYNVDNIYPNYSRDSTPVAIEGDQFIILRWSAWELGIGVNRPLSLDIWVYHRDPNYDPINAALARIEKLLMPMPPVSTGDGGWFNAIDWSGSSADLYDDTYDAHVRSESYRIVTSSR